MLSNLLVQTAGLTLQNRQPYRPRPSLAGPEQCIRKLVYYAMDVPESNKIGDRYAMTMDDSSWHEELSADWIRMIEGYHLTNQQDEVTIDGMTGHIDGILHTPESTSAPSIYIWEHKALNHFSWNMYAKGTKEPLDYFTQCAFYMRGKEISHAILLIKNKNTAQYIDYVLSYHPDTDSLNVESKEVSGEPGKQDLFMAIPQITLAALERFRAVDQYVADNRIPERPYPVGTDFPCGYCTWEDTCWEGYTSELANLGNMGEIPEEHTEHFKFHLETHMHMKNYEAEYEELKMESLRLLKSTGCRAAKCGDYEVYLQTRQKGGKITSEWVRVVKK